MERLCKFWFQIQCDWCGEVVDAGATHGNIYGELVWLMAVCPECGCGTVIKINYEDFILAIAGKED